VQSHDLFSHAQRRRIPERFSRPALEQQLNPGQLQAVLHPPAPLLVVAGAGSGKTRVITYRLARLLATGATPYRTLVVTFTNKAASELRHRASELLGGPDAVKGLWLGTFHALSARLLRRYGEVLGLRKDFVIYDSDDQKRLLTRVMADLGVSDRQFPVRQIQWAIDQAQNQGIEASQYESGDYFEDVVAKVYSLYAQRLKASNAVDFGGLLVSALNLCRRDTPAAVELASRFDHVLVDEFQDTNSVQYRLVRFLSHATGSMTVVGDEDQSIYRWRGADIRNILDFERDHPGCGVVKLEENYRSSGNVLRAANAIIARNSERRPKKLFTRKDGGDPIIYFEGETERDEAAFVAAGISEALQQGDVAPRDFAIFYRTNGQSRVLEEALRSHDLPYVVVGGLRFYDRAEVKDLLAYLRVLLNPDDSVGLLRIINTPARGIGNTTLQKVALLASDRGLTVFDAVRRCLEEPGLLSAGPRKKLSAFVELMDELRTVASTLGPAELAERVLDATGYQEALAAEASLEAEGRMENLLELVAQMREYEAEIASGRVEPTSSSEAGSPQDSPDEAPESQATLAGFLERVALVSDIDSFDPDKGAVSMMTVHTAKGLEFPRVYVTGMEEGVFPHQRSLDDDAQLEEERRLCYVAVTRAMERLVLSRVRRRRLSGQVLGGMPSRFLQDLPEDCMQGIVQPRPTYYEYGSEGQGPWQGGGWSRPAGAGARGAGGRSGAGSNRWGSPAVGGSGFDQSESQASSNVRPTEQPPPGELSIQYDEGYEPTAEGLRVGARLRHPKFGIGEVRGWRAAGDEMKVVMRFPTVGVKTILSRFLKRP